MGEFRYAYAKGAMWEMLADFYARLGVAPTATQDEIRQAYQALSLQLQRDTRPGLAAAEQLLGVRGVSRPLLEHAAGRV